MQLRYILCTWICTNIGRNAFAAMLSEQYVATKTTDKTAYGSADSMAIPFRLAVMCLLFVSRCFVAMP